jgi:hypothetical protein
MLSSYKQNGKNEKLIIEKKILAVWLKHRTERQTVVELLLVRGHNYNLHHLMHPVHPTLVQCVSSPMYLVFIISFVCTWTYEKNLLMYCIWRGVLN